MSDHHHHAGHAPTGAATDPVCGMTVDPAKTSHHAEHGGTVWHFCSAGCRAKFVAEPAASAMATAATAMMRFLIAASV